MKRERERERYTRAHTLLHNHTRAYTHYCSSMVGDSEGMGGGGGGERERERERLQQQQ